MSVVVGRARVTAQGATVGGTAHVYADGSDAVLYTDASGSTAAGNTVTVASDSTVSFYAVPGVYAVRVPVGGGRLTNTVQATVTLPVPSAVSVLDVSEWPPADGDVFTFDAASGMFVPDAPAAGSDLPTPGSGDAGKVLTVNEGEDGYELDAPSSGASEPSVYKITLTPDTPDILTGALLFTPDEGDIVFPYYYYSAWVDVTEGFDGTTPNLSLGYIVAGEYEDGALNQPIDPSVEPGIIGSLRQLPQEQNWTYTQVIQGAGSTGIGAILSDGNGGDPGSTTGSVDVYIPVIKAANIVTPS